VNSGKGHFVVSQCSNPENHRVPSVLSHRWLGDRGPFSLWNPCQNYRQRFSTAEK